MRCAPGRRRFQRCKSRICPVILSEKLGEDVEVRLNEDVKQPYLTIVVRNTEEDNKEAVKKTLHNTLVQIVKQGVDKKHIEALLDNLEFRCREQEFGRMPRGIIYAISVLGSRFYGGEASKCLSDKDEIQFLREQLSTDYFEKLLQDIIINSRNHVMVCMVPDIHVGVEKRKQEQQELMTLKSGWSEEEQMKWKNIDNHLKEWQKEPDTVISVEKDGVEQLTYSVKMKQDNREEENKKIQGDRGLLEVEQIVNFANEVALEEVQDVLQRQIDCNMAIAKEGMEKEYGARIGKILLNSYGKDIHTRAKSMAAAGSDARMNGCELPVVINSGSGNQGITASVPVIVYAEDMGVDKERLYRALVISNLVTIHLKSGIGSLSAYCGATSAGCGAGAGICYIQGGQLKEIAHTIVNGLAINSGMICDGAKASCAAKIASSVEAGLLGMYMYKNGSQFRGGDGILAKGVEKTIHNINILAREGMRKTDDEIIKIMLSHSYLENKL